MPEKLPNPHDAFFRQSFARRETARQFLIQFLPSDVCACLDFSSLHLTKESFIDSDLRTSQSDLLFEVTLADDSDNPESAKAGFIYVLFEHKSTPEKTTPLQLLRYMVRIWEHSQKQGIPLRPVVSVIVYHGVQEWTTARNLRQLIDCPPEMLRYTPDFVSHLIDLGCYNDQDLPKEQVTQATLLLLKYIARSDLADQLGNILVLLKEFLNQNDGVESLRAFLVYVALGTKQVDREQLRLEIVRAYGPKGAEIMGTIAEEWVEAGRREGLEKGLEQGLEKGLEQGLEQGLRAGIRAIIELRFPLPHKPLTDRLESIQSTNRLTELLNLSRTAGSIDELVAFLDQQQT